MIHAFFSLILLTIVWEIPNFCPIRCWGNPVSKSSLIFKMSVSSNRACPLSVPEGRNFRPLATQSRVLSSTVPRNRCAGLQHGGLSHVWHTRSFRSKSPLWKAYDTRCAFTATFHRSWKIPYPSSSTALVHPQHPSRFSTFAQKRVHADSVKSFIENIETSPVSSGFLIIGRTFCHVRSGTSSRGCGSSLV